MEDGLIRGNSYQFDNEVNIDTSAAQMLEQLSHDASHEFTK